MKAASITIICTMISFIELCSMLTIEKVGYLHTNYILYLSTKGARADSKLPRQIAIWYDPLRFVFRLTDSNLFSYISHFGQSSGLYILMSHSGRQSEWVISHMPNWRTFTQVSSTSFDGSLDFHLRLTYISPPSLLLTTPHPRIFTLKHPRWRFQRKQRPGRARRLGKLDAAAYMFGI